ncbi:MAG: phosphoglycerate kinase, partial [Acidimicrobiia bacterium]|nr:phosphoglycerate kinase [Acidimicrobiia bacterium]
VRADLNVPLGSDGSIADDFRIRSALPTLEGLVESGARVTVCSHLGRPSAEDPRYSLEPIARYLDGLSRYYVTFGKGSAGDIRVLENTRFNPGETENDLVYAAELGAGHNLFVQDAFGSVHRAHASTVGVATLLRSVAGPLLDAELTAFRRFTDSPEHPYTVVLGGAKISDKLGVISNLLPKVDQMLIGGGMCFTFLAARGVNVGASMVQDDMVGTVREFLEGPYGKRIVLPTDLVASESFTAKGANRVVGIRSLTDHEIGLDIGPATANLYADTIHRSATVFWNGPMGVFEWTPYRRGTERVAQAMATTKGYAGVGGGDSAAAIRSLGFEHQVDHLSTGGGASLELLEGRSLPGVEILERWA